MPLRTVILMDRSEEHQPIYLFSFRVKKYYFILIFFFFLSIMPLLAQSVLNFFLFSFLPFYVRDFFFFSYTS